MTNSAGLYRKTRPFEVLGIGMSEERLYRWLVMHQHATPQAISQALDMKVSESRRLLDSIESKCLTPCTPDRPRRYLPVSPDVALGSFALRRQEDLRRAREAIGE